jgi:hypothetical protein
MTHDAFAAVTDGQHAGTLLAPGRLRLVSWHQRPTMPIPRRRGGPAALWDGNGRPPRAAGPSKEAVQLPKGLGIGKRMPIPDGAAGQETRRAVPSTRRAIAFDTETGRLYHGRVGLFGEDGLLGAVTWSVRYAPPTLRGRPAAIGPGPRRESIRPRPGTPVRPSGPASDLSRPGRRGRRAPPL